MSKTVSFKPMSGREKQIAAQLGNDGWILVEQRAGVLCLGLVEGARIEKQGHMRWIRAAQIETQP